MPLPAIKTATFSNQLVTEYSTKINVITFEDPKVEMLELPDCIEGKIACQPYGTVLVPETDTTYYMTIKDQRDGKMYHCASTALAELDVGDPVVFEEIVD